MALYGNMIGGTAPLKTLQLVDEGGAEFVGVVTGSEVVFTATDNDVREGMTYASNYGVSMGTKDIPSYHTTTGWAGVPAGSAFQIKIEEKDRYDYTKLQAIICLYNTSVADSVYVDKVVIEDNVYTVGSTSPLATITVDHDNKAIELGIVNDSDSDYIIRYFTYKEEN